MGTEPICVYPKDYSSRISDLLKLVGAEQRHIEGFEDFDVIDRKVDFSKVNDVLSKERDKADAFLKRIMDKVV